MQETLENNERLFQEKKKRSKSNISMARHDTFEIIKI